MIPKERHWTVDAGQVSHRLRKGCGITSIQQDRGKGTQRNFRAGEGHSQGQGLGIGKVRGRDWELGPDPQGRDLQ